MVQFKVVKMFKDFLVDYLGCPIYADYVLSKNIVEGRSTNCYTDLCAKSVGNLTPTVASHNRVTEKQIVFGILWY